MLAYEGQSSISWALHFYENPAAKCGGIDRPSFSLTSPVGTRSNDLILRKPQPADAEFAGTAESLPFGRSGAGAWIRFDAIEHKVRGKVGGAMVAETRKGAPKQGSIGGTFEATVCPPADERAAVGA